MNFGAIGMVVGHELTHGFDDEGRQFDAKGNLDDWWTPESGKAFDERAACVKKQFDGYVAIDDLHVNGKLTLGENIADLGGIKLAFAAMQAYAKEHPDRAARSGPLHAASSSSSSAPRRPGAPTRGQRRSRRLSRGRSPLAAALPGERSALEPAPVPAGVRVQGRGQDGGPEPLRDLVAAAAPAGHPRGSVQ